MAATLPIASVWTPTSTRLCCLMSRHPLVISSCQLVITLPLVIPSLHPPLVILLCQLVVTSPLAVLSLHRPLVVLLRQLVVALPLAILSLYHSLINSSRQPRCAPRLPLILSLRRLVVASPLDALLSRPLVVLSSHLSLSRQASLLLRHHLLLSSCLHRPLVLLSCWLVVALPVLAPPSRPLVVVHRPHH